ncbi:hypothetical protein [Streptomyces sp. NPDC005969]|uniref:hypothetical protein n=1 Tax=Streptomyces sp. NPDC005969 TaxID=3156722 RepID=UPI0033D0EE01
MVAPYETGSEGSGIATDVRYATRAAGSGRRLNLARRTTPVADRAAVVTGAVGRGGCGCGAAPRGGAVMRSSGHPAGGDSVV